MSRKVLSYWVDENVLTSDSLEALALEYQLHPTSIQDCLDPEHYPKIELIDETLFIIVRFYDHECDEQADDLLSMTRKLALFYKNGLLITAHRGQPEFIEKLAKNWAPESNLKNPSRALLIKLLKRSIESYAPMLEGVEKAILQFERGMNGSKIKSKELIELYRYRRKLSVVKRLLWRTQSVIAEWRVGYAGKTDPWVQDLTETCESFYQYVDELIEDTHNLLNLQISLSSQKTNEVMRFLTVVSLFFLPLTFIVGLYGMNFKFMPELESPYGYPLVLISMALVSGFIYFKVKKRGWLDRE